MRINRMFIGLGGGAAVFYSFLAFMLLGGLKAEACPDLPNTINLPGSSFIAERISIERSRQKKGHIIHLGDMGIMHNGRCWHSITHRQCLARLMAGNSWLAIVTNGKKTGKIMFNDRARELKMISANSNGMDLPARPYLVFHDERISGQTGSSASRGFAAVSTPVGQAPAAAPAQKLHRIRVTAMQNRKKVGEYVSVFDPESPSLSRGIGGANTAPRGSLSLTGRRISAGPCKADIRRM